MKTVPLEQLSALLRARKDIVFAVVFGSSQNGSLGEDSDVDLGIYFDPDPDTETLVDLLTEVADVLSVDDVDFCDLRRADPILGFEAISGRMLCKNDPARTAEVVSLISREYEDAIWQLQHAA